MQNDSRRRDALRGAGGLLALLTLLLAVPTGLWILAGWPLPTSIPGWSEVSGALGDSYVPDTFLVKLIAVVCWFVWFELVVSVIVETIAMIRGRRAADVPLAGPMQKLAGRLVAAVGLLAVLSVARPEGAAQLVQPLVAQVKAAPAVQLAEPEVVPVAQEPAPLHPSYTVQRRDTLWDIAERHLGDPYRWVEIYEMNRDRTQPDGTVLRDPDRICPGWLLDLPVDAVGVDTPGAAPAVAAPALDEPSGQAEPDVSAAEEPLVATMSGLGDAPLVVVAAPGHAPTTATMTALPGPATDGTSLAAEQEESGSATNPDDQRGS